MKTYRCQTCMDQSGNPRGIVPSPNGSMWLPCPTCNGAKQVSEEPEKIIGFYNIQVVAPGNGTAQQSTQIVNEDFEIEQLLATYTSASLNVTILQNGRAWMVNPNGNPNVGQVPITLCSGTAASPYIKYPAVRMHVREQLTVIATDTSGANNTLNFIFAGSRLVGQATQRQQQ
jgi:hypothetical protein